MSKLCVCNQLRLEGYLTDAVIKVQDVEFQIHKIILCNCSSYFRMLFTSWSRSDRRIYDIPGLSADTMQLIIEFAYTGHVSVSEESVQDLLLAADQLIVIEVIQACWDFLEERLSPENCIGVWQFTSICHCPKLQHKAYHYMINNFEEVALGEEVLNLSVDDLTEIIAKDELNVRNERSVFKAIHQWIAHAPEERQNHLGLLLSKVRLALINEDFINVNIKLNEFVSRNAECLQMVEDALQIQDLMRQNFPPRYAVVNTVARPRLPQEILLAIGGWSGNDPTKCIEAYDFRTDYWVNVEKNLEPPRAYHGTVVYNSCFYCLGGFDRVEYFNSVCKFDLNTHTWHNVAPMYFRRCYVSTVLLNRHIYAIGGYDGTNRLNTAERYRPETNQWTVIAPMNERRSDASSATLHNKIYICGGFNGLNYLDTCEYYHPGTNQWTTITQMGSRRSGIGVIAYAGDIYAVGGFDGHARLRSAESYNPETNTWSPVPSMLTPRSNFGIEVIEDRLFVAGGFDGSTTTSKVEYYDADTREWLRAHDMGIFRSALSCCIVSGVPNIAEYTLPRDTLPSFQVGLGW